jgi:ABC-type transport system involved in cytochrome bd biosynthesis fused ATPase/permease subunit
MSTFAKIKHFLWLVWPLTAIAMLLTWYVWAPPLLLVLLVRHLLKPKSQKVTDRNWATARHNERQHRIKTAIQMHLAANGLPNTPENRAWAITSLSRSSSRGRG